VYGSNHKIKVRIIEKTSYPLKNNDRRIELNNIIKDAGIWDEVSDLDVYALIRKMKDKDLSYDLIERIQRFQSIEKTERIYLSRIKDRE
jgi:hypothetical protein